MQMVYKSGWAVRKVQDYIDALISYPPIPENEHQERARFNLAMDSLISRRDKIRAAFFSPEDWFRAFHMATDGKRGTTTPAGSSDIQTPVRIPASNYPKTILGHAGVPYPSVGEVREYRYNMTHDITLGYLNDAMATVLDPRDTRYVPILLPPRWITNASSPSGAGDGGAGPDSCS